MIDDAPQTSSERHTMVPEVGSIGWIQDLERLSLAVLLGILLLGNYLEFWMWVRTHNREIAELQSQIAQLKAAHSAEIEKLEKEKNEWKDMTFGLVPALEDISKGRRG